MKVVRLERKGNELLYEGKRLNLAPLCPLRLLVAPACGKKCLESFIQGEAEVDARKISSKENAEVIFYDADTLPVELPISKEDLCHFVGLQLYGEMTKLR